MDDQLVTRSQTFSHWGAYDIEVADGAIVAVHADPADPDQLDPDAPDAALRREIFEEFSAELERIEDEGD